MAQKPANGSSVVVVVDVELLNLDFAHSALSVLRGIHRIDLFNRHPVAGFDLPLALIFRSVIALSIRAINAIGARFTPRRFSILRL